MASNTPKKDTVWKVLVISFLAAYFLFVAILVYGVTHGIFPVPNGDGFLAEPPHTVTVKLYIPCPQGKEIYATFYSDKKSDIELYSDNKLVSITSMSVTDAVAVNEDGTAKFWEDSDEKTHFEQKGSKLVCDKPTVIE